MATDQSQSRDWVVIRSERLFTGLQQLKVISARKKNTQCATAYVTGLAVGGSISGQNWREGLRGGKCFGVSKGIHFAVARFLSETQIPSVCLMCSQLMFTVC